MSKRKRSGRDTVPFVKGENFRTIGAAEDLRIAPNDMKNTYRVGAVVRIKMHNFVTFNDVEVFPGPGLNVVVGPNGVGKSSVVSAICFGLGGKMDTVDKGSTVGGFVKRGCAKGFIELELYKGGEDGRNITIVRKFDIKNNSKWSVNKRPTNLKSINQIRKRLNIRVNNLTVFLAQSKVKNFAEQNTKELLHSVQEATDPHLTQQHEELKQLHKLHTNGVQERERWEKKLEQLEKERDELAAEVKRVEEREEFKRKIQALSNMRPWVVYIKDKKAAKQVKENKAQAEEAMKYEEAQLQPFVAMIEELKRQEGAVSEEYSKVDSNAKKIEKKVKAIRQNLEELVETVASAEEDIADVEKERKRRQLKIKKCERLISSFETQIEKVGDTNEQQKQLLNLKKHRRVLADEISALQQNTRNVESRLKVIKQKHKIKKQAVITLRAIEKNILERLKSQTRDIAEWISENRDQFTGPVYGPVLSTISVKTRLHAKWIEASLSQDVQNAFIVTNDHDHSVLNQFRKSRNYYNMLLCVDQPRDPVRFSDIDYLQQYGIEGYLDELIDCPPTVMTALRDLAVLDKVGFISAEPTAQQKTRIFKANATDERGLLKFVTPSQYLSSRYSSYGNRSRSTRESAIPEPKILIPKDPEEEKKLLSQLAELNEEYDALTADYKQIREEMKQKLKEKDHLAKERTTLAKAVKAAVELQKKLKNEQRVLQNLQENGFDQEIEEHRETIAKTNKKRVKLISRLPIISEAWVQEREKMNILLIKQATFQAKIDQLAIESIGVHDSFTSAQGKFQELQKQYQEAVIHCKKRKAEAQRICSLDDAMKAVTECLPDFDTDDLDQLDNQQEMLEAQLELGMQNDDGKVYSNIKQKMKDIEAATKQAKEAANQTEQNAIRLIELQRRWEDKLSHIVDIIDKQFQIYFEEIGCRGTVKLKKEDDFKDWGLEIWVSFRKTSELRLLTGESQSGGEKSVSTMLFLLCLQKVTDCPFRVVDEINQGMDPDNERMIFHQIVRTSDDDSAVDSKVGSHGSPQYFLVTPSLLPRLRYSRTVSCFFVHNGAWSMSQSEWQVDKFLKSAKRAKLAPVPQR